MKNLEFKYIELTPDSLNATRSQYRELYNLTAGHSTYGYIKIDPFGKLVGYIKVYADYILDLYVVPEFRGKGHATDLINKVMSENEWDGMSTNFRKENNAAMSLFTKLGFHVNQDLGPYVIEMTTYESDSETYATK